ncbi:MAG: type VI secretion system accessory protein TagJ, partial [Terriglobia bacterium]
MTAKALLQSGKLTEAIEALNVEVRDNPPDVQRRTFLFELLCFAGGYDRAEKQLKILSDAGPEAGMGALLYRGALHAERDRQQMFEKKAFADHAATCGPVSGKLNGQAFESLEDADPRIGPRLEIFAAGQYMWLPFEQIASIELPAPAKLRDLIWGSGIVKTGAKFKGLELGEVLLPVLSPLTWKHPNDEVRLGRITEWEELEDGGQAPIGQKMLLVDGEEIPILEVRTL